LSGGRPFCPPRRWPSIGQSDDGRPTTVPGSQSNLLIAGSSGAGKSYLAGLLAETWIDSGYRVLVIDPEGDHGGLGQLSETVRIDLDDHRTVPGDIVQQLRLASVVLDMSRPTVLDKAGFVRSLMQAVDLAREEHGMPHWVILDEAQMLFPSPDPPVLQRWLTTRGYVLVTHQPDTLPHDTLDLVDTTLSVPGHSDLDSTGSLSDTIRALIARDGTRRAFTAAPRRTPHTRHRHKYADAQLQTERRFHFHTPGRQPPAVAGNLTEFVEQLRGGDYPTLEHHLSRGDFSRWITGTLQDARLGQQIAQIEHEAAAARALALDRARRHIVHAIETRYQLTPKSTDGRSVIPPLNDSQRIDTRRESPEGSRRPGGSHA
jgi:Helicase HerA, central domain